MEKMDGIERLEKTKEEGEGGESRVSWGGGGVKEREDRFTLVGRILDDQ